MSNKIEVCVGKIKTELNYSTNSEKEILETVSKEINTDLNKLLISFGRVNENLLLFFLLFKTQKEILDLEKDDDREVDPVDVIKNITQFMNQNGNVENQLLIGNIIKKNMLKQLQKGGKKVALDKWQQIEEKLIKKLNNIKKSIKKNTKRLESNIKGL